MNSSTPESASLLLLTNDMEELDWYFQDMFDQFGNLYCLFDDINCLLVDNSSLSYNDIDMPPTHIYEQRSFALFPISYSSETFAPLVREDRQISHVQYLLQGQHASLACFHHYLTTCSTIFSLERTLLEL